MNLNDLSPELFEKIKECKSADELKSLADEAGFELTDELLAGIAGGTERIRLCTDKKTNPWDCPQALR
ncbi:MAG: Nif11-like leader peptide family natural product precursor [Atopobiaceae bacterium]|nr:Nif11-like leader peptide family natural product precursor [Atopobiaceae bacterium]